ncbi:hypothetical protein TRFO_01572 [Tritrichomonas foetus]|uniref:NADPH--hemoprotein reductase n=1 Tax=Tritrichomonas foetus TaxID=1144522 RepID=A0A1J4JYS9_9EUKA|nr:hypothetical protein TRFO_01572 [Tritrichomonas foetus]|eukprot:OHT03850.1 hypothetical protein TRFO_01572 [Tritrichomonas foetus]
MIPLRINSKPYQVPPNISILKACQHVNIYIPSLCYHESLPFIGTCNLCVVKVDGMGFCHACMTVVKANMVIDTCSPEVFDRAYANFLPLLPIATKAKNSMDRLNKIYKSGLTDKKSQNMNTEIVDLFSYFFEGKKSVLRKYEKTNTICFDPSKCINCKRCVSVCADVLQIDALSDESLLIQANKCVSCGICAQVCPTEAMSINNSTSLVKKALASGKKMVLIIDPSVFFSFCDIINHKSNESPKSSNCSGKLVSAARQLGFKYVFNGGCGRDISMTLHAKELLTRIEKNQKLPLFSSFCPSFINYAEKNTYIKILDHIAPFKSPDLILSRLIRGTMSKHLFIAVLTGCATKKDEIKKMKEAGDIDVCLTTNEFYQMIQEFGIEWVLLANGKFDPPFSECSSSAILSTVGGGFSEGIVRKLIEIDELGIIDDQYSPPKSSSFTGLNTLGGSSYSIMNNNKKPRFTNAVSPTLSNINKVTNLGSINKSKSNNTITTINSMNTSFQFGKSNSNNSDQTPIFVSSVNEKIKVNEDFHSISHYKAKTIDVTIGSHKIKIAVCNGIGSVRELIDSDEYLNYTLIEVSSCPGGSIFGGGQPRVKSYQKELEASRLKAIYEFDNSTQRKIPFFNSSIINKGNFSISPQIIVNESTTFHEPHETAIKENIKLLKLMPLVVYCSNDKTIKTYARLTASHFMCKSVPMMNIKSINDLFKYNYIIFFIEEDEDEVMSIAKNGRKFFQLIHESFDDLTGLSFVIFSIGETIGETLSNDLIRRNAKNMLAIETTTKEKSMDSFIRWSHVLSKTVFSKKPLIGFSLINEMVEVDDKSIIEKPARPIDFEMARIIEKEQVSTNSTDVKNNTIISLHLPDNSVVTRYFIELPSGMIFEKYDHILVLPRNEEIKVNKSLEILKLQRDMVLSIDILKTNKDNLIPNKTTIYQLFSQFLDLCCEPPKGFIRAFFEAANEKGKKKLEHLVDENDPAKYEEYIKDTSVLEFMEKYAQFGVPEISVLISAIPKIRPRIYSPEKSCDPSKGGLVVFVHDVIFGVNNKRKGLGSSYLRDPNTTQIFIKILPNVFKYPVDLGTPLILVAVDSGISALYSLISKRKEYLLEDSNNKSKLGPALLFYQGKCKNAIPLLVAKLYNIKETKIINDLFIVYSKDEENETQSSKTSKSEKIQDLFTKNSAKIWDLWSDTRAQLFYCGISRTTPNDLKNILVTITCNEGWLSIEEAMAVNNRHEFHTNIFSY